MILGSLIKNNKYLLLFCNKYIFKNKFVNKKKSNNISGLKHSLVLNTTFEILGKNNKILISKGCTIRNCNFTIYGNNSIVEIGELCTLSNAQFHLEDLNSSVKIGNNTLLTGKIHIAATEGKRVQIGNNCLFSSEIDIRNGDSHSIIDILTNKRINVAEDIIISDNVWVATRVSILKGTQIPKNCIVGASSVLTKKFFEENSIIAGNPARIVKENIKWITERI